MPDQEARSEERQITKFLLLTLLALAGFSFIVVSLLISNQYPWSYLRELMKELGIVLLAVFSVSLLYEVFLAEKYFSKFLTLLRTEVERGESNAAACASLGIMEIFPSRILFESKYPFEELLSPLNAEARLRVVGRSLYYIMGKVRTLQDAVTRGAAVELCLCDPRVADGSVRKAIDLDLWDIRITLAIFREQLAEWAERQKPSGSIELRFHCVPTLDSYTTIDANSRKWGVWDISFGRDIRDKRIFLVDLTKTLAQDLKIRYEEEWARAEVIFLYSNKEIRTNKVPTDARERQSALHTAVDHTQT